MPVFTRVIYFSPDYLPAFMEGANRFILLMYPLPLTGIIFENSSFVRFEVRRRKWLLPPFVRTSFPEPVKRNRLAVALWVLSLYFFVDFLRVTINSYHTKYRGLYVHPRIFTNIRIENLNPARDSYFFLAALIGASTISIVRPSKAGLCSTMAKSDKSSATCFKSSSAISG